MKKVNLFILIFLVIIFSPILNAEITGDAISSNITGKATSQEVGMSIFIGMPGGIPSIDLISPKNNTYLKNESILLNYTVINGDYVWYNLDGITNITLTTPIYIDTSQGSHVLEIYSNNSNGTTSSQVFFTANSSKFIILFGEYNGSTKGNSTNFLNYTYEEIQSLSGIFLENTNYGKIRFNQEINLTNDRTNTDNILDLDSNTQISQNSITIDSINLSNFNKPATIWLYNIAFINPRIMKDGGECPLTTCIVENYSGGTFKFNVTHFTTYTVEETPLDNPPGGGSSGGITEIETEEVIKEEVEKIISTPSELEIALKPGQTILREVYLTNYYEKYMNLKLEVENTSGFIILDETEFSLAPGETKKIIVNFTIGESTIPGNYIGRIKVKVGEETYDIITSLNIQSKESLFDVFVEIKNEKEILLPGEDLSFRLMVYNIGDVTQTNTTIIYRIKNIHGQIIYEEKEIYLIKNYFEKDKEIEMLKKLPPGRYILSVELENNNKLAVTSEVFEIKKKEIPLFIKISIPFLVSFILLLILWIIGKREEKKEKKKQRSRE